MLRVLILRPVKLIFIFLALLFVWFTPWVLVLNMGILFYFPYHPNGKDRFLRITGPVAGLLSNNWTYDAEIPKFCKQALVAAEDQKFYEHYGIDLESIEKSMNTNQRLRKIKRGGSTITQQLVKNAFLSRDKSYLRKAREIEGALLLNLFLSKNSQLDWYFNVIEFGPNVYGLKEAAQYYFQAKVHDLTPSQCLALVTVIPSPKKWNKSLMTKNYTSFFRNRYFRILNNMEQMGDSSRSSLNLARQMIFWKGQQFTESPEYRNEEKSNSFQQEKTSPENISPTWEEQGNGYSEQDNSSDDEPDEPDESDDGNDAP